MKLELVVLLVEDNAEDALIIGRMLKKAECLFTTVYNLAEAKAELAKQRFDAVLLDLGLPDSKTPSGTLKIFFEDKYDSAIVILTGYDDAELVREAIKYGASWYVNKSALVQAYLESVLFQAVERRKAQATYEATLRDQELRLRRSRHQIREVSAYAMETWLVVIGALATIKNMAEPEATKEELREIAKKLKNMEGESWEDILKASKDDPNS